jgi:putative addiction module antidote
MSVQLLCMQKVFINGNSLAVTVPKSFADQLNIRTGTPVDWEKTDKGLLLYIPQKATKSPTTIDPKVQKLIDKISKKYSQVWQELAKL